MATLKHGGQDSIVLMAYGDDKGDQKGLIMIDPKGDMITYPLTGKANCCICHDDKYYISLQQPHGNSLLVLTYKEDEIIKETEFATEYFYSHGLLHEGKLYMASFESGVDAVVDLNKQQEMATFLHGKEHQKGRSHYLGLTMNGQIYSVDNAIDQIYLYDLDNYPLHLVTTTKFYHENIRLMPYSHHSDCYYLNTEATNMIHVLKITANEFQKGASYEVFADADSSLGGNAISEDGKRLAVSIRGADLLAYYLINDDGSLSLLDQIKCGQMPRDIIFKNDMVHLACTNENQVEVYQEEKGKLILKKKYPVASPVTFALEY